MTTPTPRWTAETEELVARALFGRRTGAEAQRLEGWDWDNSPLSADARRAWRQRAAGILTARADAGVLIPVGGETRQEWCVQSGRVDYPCSDEVRARHQQGQLFLLGHPATRQTRTITTYPDGSTLTGPWREVTDDPA